MSSVLAMLLPRLPAHPSRCCCLMPFCCSEAASREPLKVPFRVPRPDENAHSVPPFACVASVPAWRPREWRDGTAGPTLLVSPCSQVLFPMQPSLLTRLRNAGRVIRRAKPVALGALGLIVATALSTIPAIGLRGASSTLQLGGVLLVAFNLLGRPKILDPDNPHAGMFARIAAWFKDLYNALARTPAAAEIRAGFGSVSVTGEATGLGRAWLSKDAPIAGQIQQLRKHVERLDEEIAATERRMRDKLAAIERSVAAKSQELAEQLVEVKRTQREVALGSWDYEWVGVVWIGVGIVLGMFGA
jgi:hypothetical protein